MKGYERIPNRNHRLLTKTEQLCFKCTRPVEDCCKPGVQCEFNKALKNKGIKHKSRVTIQSTCGVPDIV